MPPPPRLKADTFSGYFQRIPGIHTNGCWRLLVWVAFKMLTDVASAVATVVVPGIGEVIVVALGAVGRLVIQMKENEEMCKRVHKRLVVVYEQLVQLKDNTVLREHNVLEIYSNNIAKFIAFLQKHASKGFIRRLAGNRKILDEIQEFHVQIDFLFKILSLNHINEMSKWREEWMEDQKKARKEKAELLANNQAMKEEIKKMGSQFNEGMAHLLFELRLSKDQPGPDSELMTKAFNKMVSLSKGKVPKLPLWYIPMDEVGFDINQCFDLGSYGSVHRGLWGKGTNVVIKSLLTEEEEASDSFYKEVEVWYKLNNLHVVRLFGACHLSKPAFFVCEDAVHGNFANYFETDKSELWRFFHEAALGLFYLHSQKVVHGDLKCSNIVIGADRKAKICDFGFSYIRAQSVGLSVKAQTDAVRWKAPECLSLEATESGVTINPRFASDVYAFGMCIVEAFLGHPPYDLEDDDTVIEKKLTGEMYPRVDDMSDEEWTFVERLIDPDRETRMSLADAIDILKMFADREQHRTELNVGTFDVHLTGNLNDDNSFKAESGKTAWRRIGANPLTATSAVTIARFDWLAASKSRPAGETAPIVDLNAIPLLGPPSCCFSVERTGRSLQSNSKMDLIPDLLLEVGKLCAKMKENEDLCQELFEKAQFFWQHVETMTQDDKVAKHKIINRYKHTLQKILKTLHKHYERGLFIRIWGNYIVVGQLNGLFKKLDDLYTAMGLQSFQTVEKINTAIEKGREELRRCAEDIRAIQASLDKDGYKEGIVLLGVLSRYTDASTSSRNMPREDVELARRTFERAAAMLRQREEELPLIPNWFIPRDAVDFDDDIILDRGAYATAHVGSWGEDGLGTEVVVKRLVADDARAKEEFTRESTVWYGLDHPNIVKMYGACHVGLPIFFVCEYVKGGNFAMHFLKDKSNLWRLFYSAAVGLRYLHNTNVVHGDLKCNNILVDGDTAKICDFGFSYVRVRSQMSLQARAPQVRWKAPEALLPPDRNTNTNPRFASDVYSFGMCIIEAFLDEPPFGTDDDDTVMDKIFSGETYPRPDGIQDDEWAFVCRLCDYSWRARPTIADALKTLRMFADREAASGAFTPAVDAAQAAAVA
ncbi:unnamed protein product [Phytophthora fragariaefolia]|uniref:Unnamed protein product n=1 Tax=Phytophthora fragariaefolia TaxID=1490495 RepID=A0A9W7CVU7_9STRA|nr:unnamed protein product [Phytophthora fragariaefolia]